MKSPEFIPAGVRTKTRIFRSGTNYGVYSGLMVMVKSDIFPLFWNGEIYVKQEKSEVL